MLQGLWFPRKRIGFVVHLDHLGWTATIPIQRRKYFGKRLSRILELMIAVVIVGLDRRRKEDVKSLQSMTSVPNAQITFPVNVTENHCKFIESYIVTLMNPSLEIWKKEKSIMNPSLEVWEKKEKSIMDLVVVDSQREWKERIPRKPVWIIHIVWLSKIHTCIYVSTVTNNFLRRFCAKNSWKLRIRRIFGYKSTI